MQYIAMKSTLPAATPTLTAWLQICVCTPKICWAAVATLAIHRQTLPSSFNRTAPATKACAKIKLSVTNP